MSHSIILCNLLKMVKSHTYKFKITINKRSLKFGLVLMMVPCLERLCSGRVAKWAPSPCTWDLVQLSLQVVLESLPLLCWQLWWLLWWQCHWFVLRMHRISTVLWRRHVGTWRYIGMGIGEYICTWQSLRWGDMRLAIALNNRQKLHKFP